MNPLGNCLIEYFNDNVKSSEARRSYDSTVAINLYPRNFVYTFFAVNIIKPAFIGFNAKP